MDRLLNIREDGLVEDWLVGGEHVERVHFTEAEWKVMMTDPRFGYVQSCGHPTAAQWSDGTCGACEQLADEYEAERAQDDDPAYVAYCEREMARGELAFLPETLGCYECGGFDGRTAPERKVVKLGPVAGRADPTQTYVLECGHIAF